MSKPKSVQDLEAIEKGLAKPVGSWQMSPNDLLVQIALPLVLILAIVIQLMSLQVERAEAEESFLEPWKQQLILRLDEVFAEWEEEARLDAIESASDISFGDRFPEDRDFSALSQRTQSLADPGRLTERLYQRALEYDPEEAGAPPEVVELFRPLYDPASGGTRPDDISDEFVITPERREFAERYIDERMDQWQQQVQTLQWATINHIVSTLTIDDPLSSPNSAEQLERIAEALEDRGYPLLPAVVNEYSQQ
ncbi:MAG: hypothetical protein ACFB21_10175 [Opitutales bacterium]